MVRLLLPTWCPGCGSGGVSICTDCARSFSHWFRAEADADALPPGVPVWACAAYAGVAAKVVMAWKSGQRPDLAPVIARLGENLGRRFATSLAPAGGAGPEVLVLPAPSGRRRRWSGNEVVAPLAQAVARGMRACGWQARCHPMLHRRGGNNHHLSQGQRRADRAAGITLKRGARRQTQREAAHWGGTGPPSILLVDDVLTTGATLAASAQAAAALGPVLGAIVLAATPKPVHTG